MKILVARAWERSLPAGLPAVAGEADSAPAYSTSPRTKTPRHPAQLNPEAQKNPTAP